MHDIFQELKHILRTGGSGMFGDGGGGGSGGRQRMSLGGGGNTPPLPALSPGPDSSPEHINKTINKANKNSNSRPGRQSDRI